MTLCNISTPKNFVKDCLTSAKFKIVLNLQIILVSLILSSSRLGSGQKYGHDEWNSDRRGLEGDLWALYKRVHISHINRVIYVFYAISFNILSSERMIE